MTAMLKVCNSYLHVPLPSPISFTGNVLENFRYFREQWKYYCIATGLDKMPEDVKVSILFLTVGRDTFYLIQERLSLSDEDKNSSEKILDSLGAYFQPKVNVVWERYTFNQATQETYESPQEYLERLKKLASSCDFKENVDTVVRDRFISGIRDYILRKELANDSDLTLEKALQKCLQTTRDMQVVQSAISEMIDSKKGIVKIPEQNPVLIDSDDDVPLQIRKKSLEVNDKGNQEEDFNVGSFVVLKSDFNKMGDPPIWKIDGSALLQKFVPFQKEGQTLYKNTAVYSGWTAENKDLYYPIQVVFKQMTRKEHIVRFRKDLLKKAISSS